MADGKPVSVWYLEEERSRLAQAAVIAGYKHVSKYIRDKSLDRSEPLGSGSGGSTEWAEREVLNERMASLEQSLATTQAMLAMVLSLVYKRASTGEVSGLLAACEDAPNAFDLVAGVAPDLTAALGRLGLGSQ